MICTGGQLRPPVFGLHACRRRGGQDGRKDCDTPGGGGGYSRHSRAVPPAGQRFGCDAAGVFCEGPREEDEIRKAIRADDADFLLAERGGAVVGFALVGYAGWTPEFSCVLPHRYARLEDLAVDEAVRGQGVGGELLAAAKRWARNRRLEYLELNVLAQNENAIRLYESQDFVEATKVMRCML